ncbi:hypothetical protein J6590_024479 [Homalodisca vitripennis]|nr:hypothetical protein J6590_024479 [Homalodisca vitripennis]
MPFQGRMLIMSCSMDNIKLLAFLSMTSYVGESASNKSNDGTKTILDAIRSMDTKINTNISQVRGSIDSLRKEFQRLNDRCAGMENNHNELQCRCAKLEKDNGKLQDEVQDLQQRLNDSEQHSRCANIEIIGLPTTEGEDIYTVLEKVACVLGVDYAVTDISVAHRLRLFSNKHAYAPIIMQFVSRRMREAWLAASKSKPGLKSTQIAASLPESHVFINEQLTPHNKTLLGRARRMQREKRIQ